jgi:hypothetical protein
MTQRKQRWVRRQRRMGDTAEGRKGAKKPATPKKLEAAGLIFLTRFNYNDSGPLLIHDRLLGGREGDVCRVCRSTAGIEAPDKDVIGCIGNQACEREAGLRRFLDIALHNVEQATCMIQADRVSYRAAGCGPFDRCAGRCRR